MIKKKKQQQTTEEHATDDEDNDVAAQDSVDKGEAGEGNDDIEDGELV